MNGISKVDIDGKGTLELSGGVLRLHWKPGATVGLDEAHRVLSAISTLGQGVRLPMLIEIHDVTYSAAARRVFPDPSAVSRMALLGSSPVDQVVAMFRLPRLPTGFPVRYFTSEEKALVWLRS
ncbi:DUF7793 family protein [Arthrobacter globiformis]|uniref:STAS/SEC14 domain-containing protein n=1 Tax=Arthrobacter globiformis TaxID=1665 RepID=A0A328HEJ4_ARTGO|nr:STAS/SEC14 domain-containing protein [Arthrobacter globiformis]RAM36932.1 STAS/SEC14 domain-containing protein [Arthrobacter globiformis]